MTNSRQKGARGERELARILREYGYDCRRGQQYCGANGDADVVGLEGIHIECKRVERLNPAVFHRKNNFGWLVTMPLADFMRLYQDYEPPVPFADKAGDEDGER